MNWMMPLAMLAGAGINYFGGVRAANRQSSAMADAYAAGNVRDDELRQHLEARNDRWADFYNARELEQRNADIARGLALRQDDINRASRWRTEDQAREERINLQYATNSLRYRMEDAKRAGIHPLAAMGISPGNAPVIGSVGGRVGGSNVNVGRTGRSPVSVGNYSSRSPIPGQGIDRAWHAQRTLVERLVDVVGMIEHAKNQKLQNELVRSKIAMIQHNMRPEQPGQTDGNIIDGQNIPSLSTYKWMEDNKHVQEAVNLDIKPRRVQGGYKIDPADSLVPLYQGGFLTQLGWHIEHDLVRRLLGKPAWKPKGPGWDWNRVRNQWERTFKGITRQKLINKLRNKFRRNK